MDLIELFIKDEAEDNSGVSAIAVVDNPATESSWTAFNKATPQLKRYTIQLASQKGDLKAVDGDQQILFGAFMIPDIEIPRIDADGKKYNVIFKKEEVKKIAHKWALSNLNTALNEMHNSNLPFKSGVISHFIIDSKNGLNAPFNMNLADGTWAGYVKVLDKNKWDTFIKTGIYTGFSVEGNFYEQVANQKTEPLTDGEQSLLDSLLNPI